MPSIPNFTNEPKCKFPTNEKFTRGEVFWILKHCVLAPCKIVPAKILMDHKLVSDLGYISDTRKILSGKTNHAFGISNANKFTGNDMMKIETVSKHYDEVVAKLKSEKRIS